MPHFLIQRQEEWCPTCLHFRTRRPLSICDGGGGLVLFLRVLRQNSHIDQILAAQGSFAKTTVVDSQSLSVVNPLPIEGTRIGINELSSIIENAN